MDLYKEEKRVLKKLANTVCKNVTSISQLLTILEGEETITRIDMQRIEQSGPMYDQVKQLIVLLKTKRLDKSQVARGVKRPFAALCFALKEIGLSWLEEKLNTELEGGSSRAADHERHDIYQSSDDQSYDEVDAGPDDDILISKFQDILKKLYLSDLFRSTRPFALPFVFDVENTFVAVALEEDNNPEGIDDHCEMLKNYFTKRELLVLEGTAASGKTALMRRIAFDWANGNEKLQIFDFVLIAEFRNLKRDKYDTIIDCTICGMENMFSIDDSKWIRESLTEKFCRSHHILILLDGFDEALEKDQCAELYNHLFQSNQPTKALVAYIVISTRPGHLSTSGGRYNIAKVLGFNTDKRKKRYLEAHFTNAEEAIAQKNHILALLTANSGLNKLAETPLFLAFICLAYQDLDTGSLYELYNCIICWLIDRYQKDHPEKDVPALFHYHNEAYGKDNEEKHMIIKEHYYIFPLIKKLGKIAFDKYNISKLSDLDFKEYQLFNELLSVLVPVGLLNKEKRRGKMYKFSFEYAFPHRTIQEFLAGGVHYFWPDLEDANNSIFEKPFSDDISIIQKEELKMSDLEMFVWRIAFCPKPDIEQIFHHFFKRYKTLLLDISMFVDGITDTSRILNTYLKRCSNVTDLFIYSSTEVILRDSIDLSAINDLERVTFFSKPSILDNINFALTRNKTTNRSCILVPDSNKQLEILFVGSVFKSIELVISTIEHLKRPGQILAHPSTTLNFKDGMFKLNSNTETKIYYINTEKGTKLSQYQLRNADPLLSSDIKSTFYFETIKINENREENDEIVKSKSFFDSAMEKMNELYDDWWSASQDKETLCTPACLDLLHPLQIYDDCAPVKKLNKWASRRRSVNALKLFLSCFLKMKIGGLLICGFDSPRLNGILKKMTPISYSKNIKNTHRNNLLIDIDFLFFHSYFGIFSFIVRARKNINSLQLVKNQVRRAEEGLPLILKCLTDEEALIPVFTTLCFPNSTKDIESIKLMLNDENDCINSTLLFDTEGLRAFIVNKSRSQKVNEISAEEMKRFASVIASHRSLEIISLGVNALGVHSAIDSQSVYRSRSSNGHQTVEIALQYPSNANESSLQIQLYAKKIFLNPEQQKIFQCEDQKQLISGPPGTGKTIILLLKLLNAAQEEKGGDIKLITKSKMLCSKFNKYFEMQTFDGIVRWPQIASELQANQDDDVFIDEAELDLAMIKFLKKRLIANGRTIVALTGYTNPIAILQNEQLIEKHNLTAYSYFPMEFVTRCSNNIYTEWKEAFPTDFPIRMGHSVDGQRVEVLSVNNSVDALNVLVKSITQCLKPPTHISLQVFCVITNDDSTCKDIIMFLKLKNIPCGSLEEQLRNAGDEGLIAVAPYTDTLSFEWPFVFLVSFHGLNRYEPFHLIATSRATSRLVIIHCPPQITSIWSRLWPFQRK